MNKTFPNFVSFSSKETCLYFFEFPLYRIRTENEYVWNSISMNIYVNQERKISNSLFLSQYESSITIDFKPFHKVSALIIDYKVINMKYFNSFYIVLLLQNFHVSYESRSI